MPDWASHILIGLIICEVFNIKRKSLVLLGALLPDLLVKSELLGIFLAVSPNLYWLLMPLHTPIGAILTTAAITPLFKQEHKKTFYQLTLGWFSHLLFDLTHKQLLISGTYLLFPVSWKAFRMDIAWPDEFMLYLIPLLVVYVLIRVIKQNLKIKNSLL